jgi:hypothetical protein
MRFFPGSGYYQTKEIGQIWWVYPGKIGISEIFVPYGSGTQMVLSFDLRRRIDEGADELRQHIKACWAICSGDSSGKVQQTL